MPYFFVLNANFCFLIFAHNDICFQTVLKLCVVLKGKGVLCFIQIHATTKTFI